MAGATATGTPDGESARTRRRGFRFLDAVVLLIVIAAIAVGAHLLGFGPFANSGTDANRADVTDVELTEDDTALAESEPLEMSIPVLGLRADIDPEPCPLTNGALDPAGLSTACYYVADDRPYTLPGSDTDDLSVLAGHAAAGRPAVFDDLYNTADDTFTLVEGDELLVRTEASGDNWLVYRATDFHAIGKPSLGDDPDVWGEEAMPGRMLTISCIQPRNPFSDATDNVIVGWSFAGLADADAAAELLDAAS